MAALWTKKLDGDLKGEKISVGQAVIGYISAAVQPMVPALIGGGMIKVFLLLISKVYAPFANSSTYTLLSIVGNAVFYFMPILVAYGAAKNWVRPPRIPWSWPVHWSLLNGRLL